MAPGPLALVFLALLLGICTLAVFPWKHREVAVGVPATILIICLLAYLPIRHGGYWAVSCGLPTLASLVGLLRAAARRQVSS